MIKRIFSKPLLLFLAALFFLYTAEKTYAIETLRLESNEITILYEEPLYSSAKEVLNIYPIIRNELESVIGWEIDFIPTLLLINENSTFQKMTGNDITVAFAQPAQNLMVIDYSRMLSDPFTLEATLQHELCHLFLHNFISSKNLPRWLDGGVAQWISGGLADIIMNNRDAILNGSVRSGRFLRMVTLEKNFPKNNDSMILAYVESRSFVNYIIREYKLTGLLMILNHLREGNRIDTSIMKALNISYEELESLWVKDIQSRNTLMLFLTSYLYEVLFLAGAFLLILGYIKVMIKKKRYDQENLEE